MDAVLGAIVLTLMLVGLAVGLNWTIARLRKAVQRRRAAGARSVAPAAEGRGLHGASTPEERELLERARRLAADLAETHVTVDLGRLRRDAGFASTVNGLADANVRVDLANSLSRSSEPFEAAIGLAALSERDDLPPGWTDWAIRSIRRCRSELEPSFFDALVRRAEYPVIGPALSQIDEGISWQELAHFVARRREGGEQVTVETLRRNVARRLADTIESFLDRYEDELGPEFREVFEEWRQTTIDTEFLHGFARVWERPFDSPPALLVGRRRELVELILDALGQTPRRSLLLVGEHGVGKTAVARAALERLPSTFMVFEATAAQVQAGSIYIGELETKIRDIAERLKGQHAVWLFPAFEEALYAGQHSRSPQGMLDALLPYVESGELAIVGEISPAALERLLAERPRVAGPFDVVRVRPLDESESIQVARHALEHDQLDVEAAERTLSESFDLAQHFLPGLAAPGNLLRLVEATAAEAAEEGSLVFETTDVLAALASASGLPLAMLDPNAPLSLDDVRAYFEARVLGQSEAVESIVDRVAMAKAGLTDPTRPLGVFLFVGPTGTGKTEIAKTLAEFMFGSANRLVRLDMSEFQTPDALDRLLADTSTEGRGASLISSVRKDPFAVVLLDEFEKAAPPIWDLFLQVFDDGRLTDQQGRTADFRRCVIVLTSNIGSAIATGRGVGFSSTPEPFRPDRVMEALRRSFRPEFLNRIDRIVVFRPFERAQMRALLDKELREVLARRGLRGRPWAVELDESAYAFLVDQGFTPELGARPLKRAVEQHLLAPLAATIVEQRVPEGDQFLLVSAPRGERIEVTFVDPDADEPARSDEPASVPPRELDLRSLALTPRSDPGSTAFLLDELQRIEVAVAGDAVAGRKQAGLEAVSRVGFWEEEGRFAVLAEVEYLDRLEAALRTADKLGERLRQQSRRNGQGSSELAGFLATRLYVLERALTGLDDGAPFEVVLRARPVGGVSSAEGAAFVRTLTEMYAGWAKRRGMRLERLDGGEPTEQLLEVSGLGAATILAPETGLHVLEVVAESGDGTRTVDRTVAAVEVAASPPGPDTVSARTRAEEAFANSSSTPTQVVRRYRPGPAPLVRDAVRGYRTGRLDRVLAGDFDII